MINIKINKTFVFGALLGLAILASCSGPEKAPTRETGRRTKSRQDRTGGATEDRDYSTILSLYNKGAYDQALTRLKAFEKKPPTNPKHAEAHNLQGLIYLNKKRNLQAVHQFEKAKALSKDSNFVQYISFNLASAQYEASMFREGEQTMAAIDTSVFNSANLLKFNNLRGRLAFRLDQPALALKNYLAASDIIAKNEALKTEHPEFSQILQAQIEEALAKAADPSELDSLSGSNESNPYRDLLLFRSAELHANRSEVGNADNALRTLLSDYPNSAKKPAAEDMLRSLTNRSVVSSRSIGVLLPMTGRFAQVGQDAIQAITLAFRIFNQKEPDNHVELRVEDTGETPEQAVKALDRLFFEHHVVAVVGPLSSQGIVQITQRAQELGLPLISLAQQSGTRGDYVFQGGITPAHQSQEIARYAVQKMGLKRFAILYPASKFGTEYITPFWDTVESLGGEIVGIESYPPTETDFQEPVEKLSGLYYKEARQDDLNELEKIRREKKIKKKNWQTAEFFDLKPIVDFDAVFIPDDAKTVGLILKTFPYKGVDNVKYLGISTWNSMELIKRAERFAEQSVFVERFFQKSSAKNVQGFNQLYNSTYGRSPSATEAIAFDAASLLERSLMMAADNQNRSQIRERLAAINGFSGITGNLAFKDGQFTRKLKVITVLKGDFLEAE